MSTHSGYLVIGDISGYTSYMAQTELEHSQAVLAELLELIAGRFQPRLSIVKFEGDAVFAHAPAAQVPQGDSLVELIEATYVAFRARRDGIVRHTTCECNACRRIPMLDLKFMTHFGDYISQTVSGRTELVGSDVNLVHRLTKNHVGEQTGWDAYALFTEACLSQIGVEPDGMVEQIESYEHLGDIKTYNLDLHGRYEVLTADRRVFISPEEADISVTYDVAAPQSVVWEWLTEPSLRNKYIPGAVWSSSVRPGGRKGVGAKNHCAHGKDAILVETILDWRPFEYYTIDSYQQAKEHFMDSIQTSHLEPIDGGERTRVHNNIKRKNQPPRLLRRPMSAVISIMWSFMMKKVAKDMEGLILAELADQKVPSSGGVVAATAGETAR